MHREAFAEPHNILGYNSASWHPLAACGGWPPRRGSGTPSTVWPLAVRLRSDRWDLCTAGGTKRRRSCRVVLRLKLVVTQREALGAVNISALSLETLQGLCDVKWTDISQKPRRDRGSESRGAEISEMSVKWLRGWKLEISNRNTDVNLKPLNSYLTFNFFWYLSFHYEQYCCVLCCCTWLMFACISKVANVIMTNAHVQPTALNYTLKR